MIALAIVIGWLAINGAIATTALIIHAAERHRKRERERRNEPLATRPRIGVRP
jgi:hypothetical protein